MDENKEWTEEERNEHLEMIKHKLKNATIKDKLEKHMDEIQKIFECPISVSLVFGGDNYTGQVDERDEFLTSKKMPLSDFVSFLTDEDQSLYVTIDPLYLKDGINELSNVLVTTVDDKVIIVPKID